MGLVLDTSALIALEKSGWQLGANAIDENDPLILPAIVWAEALVGIRLADTPERATQRRIRLEAIRSITGIEPFSMEIAEHYADIFAELHRKGNLIPQNDMAVAATARCHGCAVLVGPRDEAHFRRVDALRCQVIG